MSTIVKNFTFSPGATILASEHNSNFDTIYTDHNGNITNVNIASGAAIANSKLNLANITQNIALSGDLTLTGSANDWSGATISDGGTVTTIDINGGTIDGTNIGASTQGTAHVSTLKVGTTNQGDVLYDNGTSLVRLTPGTSGQFLKTQGAGANPTWDSSPNVSNTVFCWAGVGDDATATALSTSSTTYVNMLRFQFTKIAGLSTVTVNARMWSSSASATAEALLKVLINTTLTEEIQTTTSTTPTWIQGGTTIDVSSLSNGTTYDGLIQLKQEDNGSTAYCSAITLIGS